MPTLLTPDGQTRVFSVGDLRAVNTLPSAAAPLGSGMVRHNEKIFKAGTFKDSMGRLATWTAADLQAMVDNFNRLRDAGSFPRVPIRSGPFNHASGPDSVVGWLNNLKTDGAFLYADFHFTEPTAFEKYDRGTYGPRSAELGRYEDNNQQAHFPVVMGLSFVDIAAVEGLFSHPTTSETSYYAQVLSEGEQPMPPESNTDGTTPPAGQGAAGAPAGSAQGTTTPPGNQSGQGSGTPADGAATGSQQAGTPGAPGAAGTAQPPVGTGSGAPSEGAPGTFSAPSTGTAMTFSINGAPTSDFAAVQRHITVLEEFARNARDDARRDFVKGLAVQNRITNPQIEQMTNLVLGMSDDQFTVFKATYDFAAPVSGLGPQGAGGQGSPGPVEALDEQIAVQRETLKMLERSGYNKERLEKTQAFSKLNELEKQRLTFAK